MNINNKYLVYVGTVRGSIAHTCCIPGQSAKFDLSQVQKGAEISALTWGRQENEILIGNKNGIVNIYDIGSGSYVHTLSNLEGKGAITGIGTLDDTVLIALRSGHINLWNSNTSNKSFSLNLDDKGTLDCFAQNSNTRNIVATGGAANDLKLWDVQSNKCIFKAKSMGHDELNLPLPTSVRGIIFLPNNNLVSCVTKEGNVLLYDDRAQRKPISVLLEKNASYTTIANAHKPDNCVVGTTKGYMQMIDTRKPLKVLKTIKSFMGSITGIVCDQTNPLIATASLDRYLRIYNLDTKELLHKEYLKHNLTSIIMRPIIKSEPNDLKPEELQEKDEEFEKLFDNMEVIVEKNKSQKRKNVLLKLPKSDKKRKKMLPIAV